MLDVYFSFVLADDLIGSDGKESCPGDSDYDSETAFDSTLSGSCVQLLH